MFTYQELLSGIKTNHEPHVDPLCEDLAKIFALDFGFADRAPSLALALQEAVNDWLDEQEQADRKASEQ